MLTIITRVILEEGMEAEWDEVMSERLETARTSEGWVAGQILRPVDSPRRRVIVGVWESRQAWKSWHEDPAFGETRERLADLGADDGGAEWHETIYRTQR